MTRNPAEYDIWGESFIGICYNETKLKAGAPPRCMVCGRQRKEHPGTQACVRGPERLYEKKSDEALNGDLGGLLQIETF